MDRVAHLSGYDRERVCVPQVCDCKQRDCRYQRFLKTCDKNLFLIQLCNHTLLVAAANPCPCGFFGGSERTCASSQRRVHQ